MSAARRLPLLKVIWGTFALPWMHRGEWLRAISYPFLGFFSVLLLWYLMDDLTEVVPLALWYAAYLFMTSWLAVCTHRVVLVDTHLPWSWPQGNQLRIVAIYLAALGVLWVMWLAVTALLTAIAVSLTMLSELGVSGAAANTPPNLGPDPAVQALIDRVALFAQLPGSYLAARLSLLLPAIALERVWSPRAAWEMSRGNGWRLAVVVIALPYLFSAVVDRLTRDGASAFEVIALSVAAALLTSLEIVTLSLSYRELEPSALPPTDPPG